MGTEEEKPKAATKAPVAPVATVEHWAREKGMLPEFTDGPIDPARLKRAPKSPAPKVHNLKFASFARAKNSLKWDTANWPTMTEAEFDKAIAAAAAHEYH